MRANNSPWGETMTHAPGLQVRAGLLFVALLLGACDSPVQQARSEAPPAESEPAISMTSVLEGTYNPAALVTCNVTIATEKVVCTSPQDTDPLAPPPVGGHGTHVRLVSNSPKHVPDSLLFRFRIRVQNLLPQTIGSSSGPVTGLRVFIHNGPTTTGGSGTVTVMNADGTAEFTSPNQSYFQYAEKVSSLAQTGNSVWKFNVPATVTSFRFRAYVSTQILPIIVFDMEQAGNRDIFAVNVDGSGLRRLTTHPGVDMSPTAAFERVVFVSYRHGNAELYSVPLMGGVETRLTTTSWNETQPAIGRSNAALAYVSDVTGLPRVVRGDANGAGPLSIPTFGHNGAVESSPTWLVDGNRLAYVSTGDNTADLFRIVLSSGAITRLIAPRRQRFEPKVSPDGTMLVHSQAGTDETNSEIWLYVLASGEKIRFTQRNPADTQPTFLHDNRVAWLYGAKTGPPKLRWSTLDGTLAAYVNLPATPANPYGVPLRP